MSAFSDWLESSLGATVDGNVVTIPAGDDECPPGYTDGTTYRDSAWDELVEAVRTALSWQGDFHDDDVLPPEVRADLVAMRAKFDAMINSYPAIAKILAQEVEFF